jgi:hypothetical protein
MGTKGSWVPLSLPFPSLPLSPVKVNLFFPPMRNELSTDADYDEKRK